VFSLLLLLPRPARESAGSSAALAVQGDLMLYTRRELGRLALAGLPAAGALLKSTPASAFVAAKPNSKWAGVQVGMNIPYNFGATPVLSADEILERCVQLGVSALELRSQPVEAFMGVPAAVVAAARAPGGRAATPTPEQVAARKTAVEDLRKWRAAAPMSKAAEFRKKYEDAGVMIEIVKFDGIYALTDAELDYSFELARRLGARAISCEIDVPQTKRVGQFADKHKMMVGYHGHTETGPAQWQEAFSFAKHNGANLDIGHFLAGNKTSPVPFLKQHHERITHVHVKDKTLADANVPFGQGDTPIKEVLQVIRDNKWKIQATIEFEYPVPQGSDRMTELAKCLQYCKDALA
jgi:sugar phosphate isomerase/epimerase